MEEEESEKGLVPMDLSIRASEAHSQPYHQEVQAFPLSVHPLCTCPIPPIDDPDANEEWIE